MGGISVYYGCLLLKGKEKLLNDVLDEFLGFLFQQIFIFTKENSLITGNFY